MLSLKFAQAESYKFKVNYRHNDSKQKLQERYNGYARELIYLNYFKLLKKVENGEIIKRINSIAKIDQLDIGRKGMGSEKGKIVLFSHSYTLKSLHEYTKIDDIENYKMKKGFKLNTEDNDSPILMTKYVEQKDNDSTKMEKNAILEVMLGSLWNRPFSFNKFPYLSEDYTKLSDLDKENVRKIYNQHLSKYQVAKKVFYQKNVKEIE